MNGIRGSSFRTIENGIQLRLFLKALSLITDQQHYYCYNDKYFNTQKYGCLYLHSFSLSASLPAYLALHLPFFKTTPFGVIQVELK